MDYFFDPQIALVVATTVTSIIKQEPFIPALLVSCILYSIFGWILGELVDRRMREVVSALVWVALLYQIHMVWNASGDEPMMN